MESMDKVIKAAAKAAGIEVAKAIVWSGPTPLLAYSLNGGPWLAPGDAATALGVS